MRPDPIPRRAATLRVCPAAALILTLLACAHGRAPLGPAEAPAARGATTPAATGPNFLIIVTDDQRYDAFHGFMPITESRIAGEGVEFTRAYATTPLCCPSRSSILTGRYARNHGVTFNGTPLSGPTFANYLHDAGYYTAHIGKFLNSWNGKPRPEYDYWVGWSGSGDYVDPYLNANGTSSRHSGYLTHVLRDHALTAIDEAVASGKPFMIYIGHKAPHDDPIPAPEDVGRYAGWPAHNPPNFNEADISDKPAWLPGSTFGGSKIRLIEHDRIGAYETLWSVDQANGALLDRLAALDVLDNTFVLFLSDNGFMWGEHRIYNTKNLLYEESARLAFAVRYPPLVAAPRVESALIANIDIAPTIYELAGIPLPAGVDGVSMVPLLQSGGVIHDDIILETWNQNDGGRTPLERGVHTGRYVYWERPGYIPELYDLDVDPYQLQNLSQDSAYEALASNMRVRMNGGGGPPPPPPPLAQCGNGTDDDADGKTDYPADPGCTSSSDNSESPDPAPNPAAGIALSVTVRQVGAKYYADLAWTGAQGAQVDVFSNDRLRATTANDGAHTDNLGRKIPADRTYQVCEAGTATCSNGAQVTP